MISKNKDFVNCKINKYKANLKKNLYSKIWILAQKNSLSYIIINKKRETLIILIINE